MSVEQQSDGSYLIRKVEFPLELPNGFLDREGRLHREVDLSPTTGLEEDLLTDEKVAKQGRSIERVLGNCLVRLGDFTFPSVAERSSEQKAQVADIMSNLLLNDQTFLVVMLRRISLRDGDTHRIKTLCPAPSCHHEFTAVVDLATLPVYPAKDLAQEFSFRLPVSGLTVVYRHLKVLDSPRLREIVKKHSTSLMSAGLWARIVSIDGKPVVSPKDLQGLPTADREDLREEMNESEGGLDVELTIECPECHGVERTSLQVDPSFFFPSSSATRRK